MKKEKLAEELRKAESFYQDACRCVEDYRKECMRLLTESDDPDFTDQALRLCEFTTDIARTIRLLREQGINDIKKLEAEDMEVRG